MVLLSRWRIVAIAVMDGGGGIRRTLTEMGDAGRIETSGGRGIPTGGTAPGLPLGKGGSWQRGWDTGFLINAGPTHTEGPS